MVPPLSFDTGYSCDLCCSARVGETGHDAEIQLLEENPEHYQPGELIKVMSGDKETGCQSSSSTARGGSKSKKLPLKSSSSEMWSGSHSGTQWLSQPHVLGL